MGNEPDQSRKPNFTALGLIACSVCLIIANVVLLNSDSFSPIDAVGRFMIIWFVFGVIALAGAVACRISWIVCVPLITVSAIGFLINANLLARIAASC